LILVPVVSSSSKPLMPCHPARARELIRNKKAKRRFKTGIFYIQLIDRSEGYTQETVVGIDPGSKKEGYTIKSYSNTYLNIQSDTVNWVKDSMKSRREVRRNRRQRNTPYRKCRFNRKIGGLSPSTKARWQLKLRVVNILRKLYPITVYVVEDIKASTHKGSKRWNKSFSPLEVGKNWFYSELKKIGKLELKQGFETAEIRNALGLKKLSNKLSDNFNAHCVDSFVLANSYIGGHTSVDNTLVFKMTPLQFHKRQLHVSQPSKGGVRKNYGGTISLNFKRGSLVKHEKYGISYIGGSSKGRISLHCIKDGKRFTQTAKPEDCVLLTYNYWRWQLPP